LYKNRKRGVIFITPAKWFLFFIALKNKDIREIAITLRLEIEYLNGKRNSQTASIFSLNIYIVGKSPFFFPNYFFTE
jgi:hypothetical protein